MHNLVGVTFNSLKLHVRGKSLKISQGRMNMIVLGKYALKHRPILSKVDIAKHMSLKYATAQRFTSTQNSIDKCCYE